MKLAALQLENLHRGEILGIESSANSKLLFLHQKRNIVLSNHFVSCRHFQLTHNEIISSKNDPEKFLPIFCMLCSNVPTNAKIIKLIQISVLI